jgi:hypothetical protein
MRNGKTDPKPEKGIGKKPSRSAMKANDLPGRRKDYKYTGQKRTEFIIGSGSKEDKAAERKGLGQGEKGVGAVMVGPNYERVKKPLPKLKAMSMTYGGSTKDKTSGTGTKGVTKKQVGRVKKK